MIWTLCRDADDLAIRGCERILRFAAQAIEMRGAFKLVLAGGSTPDACYRLLAESDSDWCNWHIYFGDERCLPARDPQRNSLMAERSLLARVPVPARQIHPIPAHLGAEAAARSYSAMLVEVYPFDLVLLGLGEDGHTASLFPGSALDGSADVVAIRDAPKPPAERVSLNAAALSNCHHLLYLISGEGKREAVRRWRDNAPIPAAAVTAFDSVERLVDLSAWG
ncbi:MAG: 6-phosphogluconolactonase [Gammaproteobacteria bacterium]|nr:6-phosphogluconolactonase [Gammaproteobacteria bacterium]